MIGPPDWVRLGNAVVSRRVELGYRTREDFSREIDLSYRALSDLESGKRKFSSGTYALLEQALKWPLGTVDTILRGQDAPAPARITAAPRLERDRTPEAARRDSESLALQDAGALTDAVMRQGYGQLTDPSRMVATALRVIADNEPLAITFGDVRELNELLRMCLGITGQLDPQHPLVASLETMLDRATTRSDALLLAGMRQVHLKRTGANRRTPLKLIAELAAIPMGALRMLQDGKKPLAREQLERMAAAVGVELPPTEAASNPPDIALQQQVLANLVTKISAEHGDPDATT